jgi:hypothetical protein
MTDTDLDKAIDEILNYEHKSLRNFLIKEDQSLITDTNAKKLLGYIYRTKDLRKLHLAQSLSSL